MSLLYSVYRHVAIYNYFGYLHVWLSIPCTPYPLPKGHTPQGAGAGTLAASDFPAQWLELCHAHRGHPVSVDWINTGMQWFATLSSLVYEADGVRSRPGGLHFSFPNTGSLYFTEACLNFSLLVISLDTVLMLPSVCQELDVSGQQAGRKALCRMGRPVILIHKVSWTLSCQCSANLAI